MFDFRITCFGTATLQQLQHIVCLYWEKTRPTNLTIRPEVSGIHRCKGKYNNPNLQDETIK